MLDIVAPFFMATPHIAFRIPHANADRIARPACMELRSASSLASGVVGSGLMTRFLASANSIDSTG